MRTAQLLASATGRARAGSVAPPPVGGSGTVSGTVTISGAGTLNGGLVRLYASNGTTIVATAVPAGSGTYSMAVGNGTYYVVLHPAFGYALHSSEPDATTAAVTSAAQVTVTADTQTKNFTVVAANYYDDFSVYTSSANLRSTWPNGTETDATDNNGQTPGSNVELDATGSPSGGKCARYDYPARPASGCNNDITIKLAMRFNPQIASSTWYLRWSDKMSLNWENGSAASCPAGTWELKWLLFHAGSSPNGDYELLMQHGKPTGNTSLIFNPGIIDNDTPANSAQGNNHTAFWLSGNTVALGLPSVWPGTYRLWVLEVLNHGAANAKMNLYADGVLVLAFACQNLAWTNSNFGFLDIGANLDSGPDNTQSRWIADFSISKTRPAMVSV